MKEYIAARLRQKSTWVGLVGLASAAWFNPGSITPDTVVAIAASLGLIHIDHPGSE